MYNFQVQNPKLDLFIKTLLRSYAGLFEEYIVLNEFKLAKAIKADVVYVKNTLEMLHKLQVVDYIKQNGMPKILFTQARVDTGFLAVSKENYTSRKKQAQERIQAVIDFVSDQHTCRNRKILQYFNETDFEDCGTCDVCLHKNKQQVSDNFAQIKEQLLNLLEHKGYDLNELISLLYRYAKEDVVLSINELTDDKKIQITIDKQIIKI